MSKWTSRKFLLAVAAFAGSIGTSLIGLFKDCPACVIAGNVCMMLSAGIYAAMEAMVDAAAVDKGVEIVDEIEIEEEDDEDVVE